MKKLVWQKTSLDKFFNFKLQKRGTELLNTTWFVGVIQSDRKIVCTNLNIISYRNKYSSK